MNPDVYLAARDIIRETGWIPRNPHQTQTGENCVGTALSAAVAQFEGNDVGVLEYHKPLLQVCVEWYGISDFIGVNDRHINDEDEAVELFEATYKQAKNGNTDDGGNSSGHGLPGSPETDWADWDLEPG